MKICCYVDLHGDLPETPNCDLVIVAGDIAPSIKLEYQSDWFNTNFADWTHSLPCEDLVFIAGNHDRAFEKTLEMIDFDCIKGTYLYNSSTEVKGIKIWGSPWTLWFNDWAFNFSKGAAGLDEAEMLWNTIPDDTNIIVTHGPLFGHGDIVQRQEGSVNAGDEILREKFISLPDCSLHICGHIHEGHGERRIYPYNDKWTINASHFHSNFVNPLPPIVIDYPIKLISPW